MKNAFYLCLIFFTSIPVLRAESSSSSSMFIKNMTMSVNPNYGRSNFSLYNLKGKRCIDIAIEFTKELKVKTMFLYQIFRILDGKKTKLLPFPKVNFCDLLSSVSTVPVLSDFFRKLATYGHFVQKCPYKPGVYYIKQFDTQSTSGSLFLPRGLYLLSALISDENMKKVNVVKIELYADQL